MEMEKFFEAFCLEADNTHVFVSITKDTSYYGKEQMNIYLMHELQKYMLLVLLEDKTTCDVTWAHYSSSSTSRSTFLVREKNSKVTYMGIPKELLSNTSQECYMRDVADFICDTLNKTTDNCWKFNSGRYFDGQDKLSCLYLTSRKTGLGEHPYDLLKDFQNHSPFLGLKESLWFSDYRKNNPGSDLY